MFFSEHRLKMTSLRIGKHRIVKNIASLRKVNIAHPYIYKINSELSSLHDCLESMEQERLEEINAHRVSTTMPSPTQEDPAQSKATWQGANPPYPSF